MLTHLQMYKAHRTDNGPVWCVAWATAVMPGIAFWYHRTRQEARETMRQFRRQYRQYGKV